MNGLDKLTETFGRKVMSADDIKIAIGERPREKKVIMCHGVFDVVHPGHLRHLMYAKSKADILVASLTADKHITKGTHRPHVTQRLRALNLAAFEIVDYVVIDTNATPIQNLALLEPDFFAKGYEYVNEGMPEKTTEEARIVESYGGEIIFTPGDIVYSSSTLIESAAPSLKLENLLTLMQVEELSFDNLRETLDKLNQFSVHLVGDTIVDSYTQTTMIGGQTKTPTMSVLYESRKDYVGGAGIVAKHMRAAGADVKFSTVLGEDPLKDYVLDDLRAANVECNIIIDPARPTTNKNAFVAAGYRLLKVDTLDNNSINDQILQQLTHLISSVDCDAVVFSDFRHGIFNKRTIPTLIDAIPQQKFTAADSQVASRWGNITEFKGFDLVTPNEREARFALADQDSGIKPLAFDLFDEAQCSLLILKLGDRGVLTCRGGRDVEGKDPVFSIDSFVENVTDAVGAGDALLSYAVLSMLATNNEVIATLLGSMAAACLCEREGNVPITPEEVKAKIDAVERYANYS